MAFNFDVSPVASGFLSTGVMIFGLAMIVVVLATVFLLWRQQRRYNYITIILAKDAFGKPILQFGKGGIFLDKKVNYKRFWIQGTNASLSADNMPYVQSPKNKYVFLRKLGEKNYSYISFESMFDEISKITIGEEDINSAIIDFDKAVQVFGTSTLEKLLPYIPLIISGVFIIGMVYLTMKNLPQLMEQMQVVAETMKQTATVLAGKGGTVVT